MKRLLLLLLALIPFSAKAAEDKHGGWFGLLAGGQSATAGGTITPFSYGATLGFKGTALGFGTSFFTGTNKTTIRSVTISQSSRVITASLNWFPGGSRIFYIGPALSYATLKVGASVGAKSVTISSSGLVYGGVAGLNIPLGAVSIGIDGSYQVGSDSVSIASYLGSLKLWF